jgi:hypothetical protein
MAREIQSDDEALEVARWMQANKSDPNYGAVRKKLQQYVDSQPKPSPEEVAANTTDFGARVYKAGADAPDDGLSPMRVETPKIRGPRPEDGGPMTNQQLESAGVLPKLQDPNAPTSNQFPPNKAEGMDADFAKLFGAPFSQAKGGAIGSADVGLSLGTTAAASALGGFSAALATPFVGVDRAKSWLDKTIDFGTYTPKTAAGRTLAQGISVPMEVVDTTAKDLSFRLANGNPEMATLLYSAVNMIPFERGATALGGRFAQAKAVKNMQDFYRTRGVDLGADSIDDALQRWARDNTGDVPRERGRAMENLPTDVKIASDQLKGQISATEAAVTNSPGAVPMTGIQATTRKLVTHITQNFPEQITQSPGVQSALKELNALEKIELANRSKPNARANYRTLQSLSHVRNRIENTPMDGTAKKAFTSTLDDFINRQIDQGLVRGDDTLKANTQLAASLRAQYKKQFESDSAILRMATGQDSSPEVFRKYIMGLSTNGFKEEAVDVVRRLKSIFGEDSPQVNAIRIEFLSDAIEPLRGINGAKPDVSAFIAHYQNVTRKNPKLIDELSPYAHRELEEMYRLAIAHRNTGGRVPFTINPIKMFTRVVAGHSIARHGAMQQAMATILERFVGRSKQKVTKEVTEALIRAQTGDENFKINAPMFLNHTGKLQGLYAAMISREYDENKDE